MHEQPLRLVPPRRVALVFFGHSELVRCRASLSPSRVPCQHTVHLGASLVQATKEQGDQEALPTAVGVHHGRHREDCETRYGPLCTAMQ